MIRVRKLGPDDVADFRRLRLEMLERHPEAFGSNYADWVDRPDSDFLARLTDAHVVGAYSEASLIGLAAMDREKGARTRHRATLTMVYVQERFRGQGVIDALLEALDLAGGAMGLTQIELCVASDNAVARRAYLRAGYESVATLPRALRRPAGYADEDLMIRRLDEGQG